jgi:hypothetical protein
MIPAMPHGPSTAMTTPGLAAHGQSVATAVGSDSATREIRGSVGQFMGFYTQPPVVTRVPGPMTPGGNHMALGKRVPMTPGGADEPYKGGKGDKGNTGGKGDTGSKGGKGDYDKGGKGDKEDYGKDGPNIEGQMDLVYPNLNDVARNDHVNIWLRYLGAEEERRRLFGEPHDHIEHDVDKIYAWYDHCLARHRCTPTWTAATTSSESSSSSSAGPRTSKGGKGGKADNDGKGTDGKDKKSKRGGPYSL